MVDMDFHHRYDHGSYHSTDRHPERSRAVSELYGDPAPDRRISWRQRNGDQEVLSWDKSMFREGSAWQIPVASTLYALVGNQQVMKYWAHNTGVTEAGAFTPRDNTGACGLICYCEDDTIRFFGAPSANRGTAPVWTLYTTYNNLTGNWTYIGPITPSQTVGIVGTTTNNSVQAGSVGEFVTATVAVGSAVALTTAVSANITSISLTAGDWDVRGVADFNPGATTSITLLSAGLGTTTGVQLGQAGGGGIGTDPRALYATAAEVPGANVITLGLTDVRVSLSGTTTIFFVANATFSVSTLSVFGTLAARRIR
jgi:hypothetical protein